MRKDISLLYITLSLTISGVLMGATIAVDAQSKAENRKGQQGKAKVETAGQKYKNIKVLRNLPASELMPTMQSYNKELNVKCDFCHVAGGFEKDDNPNKEMSRDMIRIVQDLNSPTSVTHRTFKLKAKANCFLCHHGHPEAITSTPVSEQ